MTVIGTPSGFLSYIEYIKKHEMYRLVFDPFQPNVYESALASGMTD